MPSAQIITEPTLRHQFAPPGVSTGSIRLQVKTSGRGGRLTPYLRGVPLSEGMEVVSDDTVINLAVERLPHVTLPAEIRIGWDDGTDACPPLILSTEAEAVSLAGNGVLEEISVVFQNGMVKGQAVNYRNGVERPMILGRVNGVLLRPVDVRLRSAHEAGGAVVAFSMPVDPSDFSSEGGVLELVHAPEMTVLWRSALAPVEDPVAASVETRRRLAEAEQRMASLLSQLETRLGQDVRKQNQLIEDVVSYMLALIHDRANRSEVPGDTDRNQARRLINLASSTSNETDDDTLAVVGPISPFMGWGWSSAELNRDRIELRRMHTSATVLNPHPERKVARIALTVVDAAPEAMTSLRLQADGAPVPLQTPTDQAPPCTISAFLQPPLSVSLINLTSGASRDGLAIRDIRFFYA